MRHVFSKLCRQSDQKLSSIPEYNKPSSFFKPAIQPQLTINKPDDEYEREADAMADKVMRMRDGGNPVQTFFKPSPLALNRKCSHCEEEEKNLQRKEVNNEQIYEGASQSYIENLAGGTPLSEQELTFFEPKFGYNFSDVRLHTDNAANESAKGINALAYTTGNHIVFAKGQYSSETDTGKRLMAHELTHIIQQSGQGDGTIQRVHPGVIVSAAVLAAVACAYPFYSYALDNYLHKGDKWMHCWVSCKIGFYCGGPGIGSVVSILIGAGKEVVDAAADQLGYNMHGEFADFVADLKGTFCNPFSTCVNCCDNAYP